MVAELSSNIRTPDAGVWRAVPRKRGQGESPLVFLFCAWLLDKYSFEVATSLFLEQLSRVRFGSISATAFALCQEIGGKPLDCIEFLEAFRSEALKDA